MTVEFSSKARRPTKRRSIPFDGGGGEVLIKGEAGGAGGSTPVDVLLASIKDPSLRARASDLHRVAAHSLTEAAATVDYIAPAKPTISLSITVPRPMPRIQAQLARLLRRPEVRLDNRPLARVLFDEDHYLSRHGISLGSGRKAFDHYLTEGRRQGLSPHPMIDTGWYDAHRSKAAPPLFDLLAYLATPERFRDPVHPLFDADHYLGQNAQVEAAQANPLAHFLLFGWRERRTPNVLFDPAWYLAENPDVLEAGGNPLVHYVNFGAAEGRQPHVLFDRAHYLLRNPELGTTGLDAYVHYITAGRFDGQSPNGVVESIAQHIGRDAQSIAAILASTESSLGPEGLEWPPGPPPGYDLPVALRRFIGDQFGAGRIALYSYLMSVIAQFSDQPEAFDDSPECSALMVRVADRSRQVAATSGETPDVSIVLPVFNNLLYTLTAISSVLENAGASTFEIIVADDASSDATADVIGRLGGVVRLERATENAGFLRNCNAAAAKARGRLLVFLNNDVLVMPGWLDALVAPLNVPDVGLTGSRLLGADGRLQEAGGIFWSDGSARNFGRDSDAGWPEFSYLKDVDYVSGASIALEADVWRRLRGFDTLFSPAYCEDADLAFRIRETGLRTVYQPLSTVIHHEGRSHGRDLGSGVKAYQVVNQAKFLERWKDVLARENLPPNEDDFLARDRSRDKPRILIVDHYIPQWDRDAGSRTVYLYIKMFLEQGFAVTFWADDLRDNRAYGDPLRQMGVEIVSHPVWRDRFPEWIKANGHYLDYALLCRPHVADKYIDNVRASSSARLLYYGVDLHHKRMEAAYAVSPDQTLLEEADRWLEIERRVCQRCDVVMYPGSHEVDLVKAWTAPTTAVVNFPIVIFSEAEIAAARADLPRRESASPHQMIFVGGFSHEPNVTGIKWFVSEVLPRLRLADPRFHLKIVGSNAPQAVIALAGSGVTFLGRVTDVELDVQYRQSGLAVVPLLFGGGVKGKVIEAMGKGVPVVMTSVGAQGLPAVHTIAFVADDAQAMADAILRATVHPADAIQKASLAMDFIQSNFSTDAVRRLLAPYVPELSVAPDLGEY